MIQSDVFIFLMKVCDKKNIMIKKLILLWFFSISLIINETAAQAPNIMIPPFTVETASKFSNLAFSCISTEYPNKISHTLTSDEDVASPENLHPAFWLLRLAFIGTRALASD